MKDKEVSKLFIKYSLFFYYDITTMKKKKQKNVKKTSEKNCFFTSLVLIQNKQIAVFAQKTAFY